MSFTIAWMLDENGWEQARLLRQEHGPGSDDDLYGWERATSLFAAVQIRNDELTLFPEDRLREEVEDLLRWQEERGAAAFFPEVRSPEDDADLLRWQAEHGDPVWRPATTWECFGWPLYPLHLADWLCWHLEAGGFIEAPDGTDSAYKNAESNFYVTFDKRGGQVVMQSSWEHSPILWVPLPDLVNGVRAFVANIIDETERHAPELLDWPQLLRLEQWLGTQRS